MDKTDYNKTLPPHYQEIFKKANVILLEHYKSAFKPTKAKCLTCQHEWNVRPRMVVASYQEHGTNSCPVCAKEKISNKKKKSYDQYKDLFKNANVQPLEEYKGFKKKTKFKCLNCNSQWITTIQVIKQGWKKHQTNGCPKCKEQNTEQRLAQLRKPIFDMIKEKNVVVLTEGWNGERHYSKSDDGKIVVKNLKCGHVFRVTPCNLLYRNVVCPKCGYEKRIKELIERNIQRGIEIRSDKDGWELYKALVDIETRKTYEKYKDILNPDNKSRSITTYHLDHVVSKAISFRYDVPPEITGGIENLRLVPADYNRDKSYRVDYIPYTFRDYISYMDRMNLLYERIEHILSIKFNKINLNDYCYCEYDNKVLGIIPIDGSFSDDKYYFSRLREKLINKGQRAFFIFEDEFEKIDIVTSKIKYFYNKRDEFEFLNGRSVKVCEISNNEKKNFLEANHLQGDDKFATINIGGYYNDELVAIMTFCKPRVLLGYKNRKNLDNIWELSRFACKNNIIVRGGASKLLKYFEIKYSPIKIISYGDLRYVNEYNNVYRTCLKFETKSINRPGYYYVINGKRHHRWGFRKDVLKETLANFDENKTEEQNLLDHGIYRVWNCGTITFEKQLTK